MNKKTLITLLLSITTSFSAFSTGNDLNNQDLSQIERTNRQTNAIIKMTFTDLTEAEQQEIFELTLPILKKSTNWDFFAKKIFFDKIHQLKNTNNLKQKFEFINNILQKIESDKINFISIIFELFKIDTNQYDHIYPFLQNIEQVKWNNTENILYFIKALEQINNETLSKLTEWQQVLFFILSHTLFEDEYKNLIQFIATNPFSPILISYINLLKQRKTHDADFLNSTLINDIIKNNENDFNHALPLLEKIFAIHPSWTTKNCQHISSYILSRASSSDFRERFNIACTIFSNKNWNVNDCINCINHLYQLPNSFEALNNVFQSIDFILSQSIDLDWDDYKTLIEILSSRKKEEHHSFLNYIISQWKNTPHQTKESLKKIIASIKSIDQTEQQLLNQANELHLMKASQRINNRRELIRINQLRFDLLFDDEKKERLDEFRGKRLQILLQHPINDSEGDCLEMLNGLDELFFQQIATLKTITQIQQALQDHLETRLETHLSVANTEEETMLINLDEEKEAALICEDAREILEIASQKETSFKTYLKTCFLSFIQQNIRDKNTQNLTREAFLNNFDPKEFENNFIETYLTDYNDAHEFEQAHNTIIQEQKGEISTLLEKSLKQNINLTYDAFLTNLPQHIDNQMVYDLWNETAEDLRTAFIFSIEKQKEDEEKKQEKIRLKRLERFNKK